MKATPKTPADLASHVIVIKRHEAQCQCGCKKIDMRSRMEFVEKRNHFRHEGGSEEQNIGQRWFVRKLCKPLFIAEMNAMTTIKTQVALMSVIPPLRDLLHWEGIKHTLRYWWTRATIAPSLYRGMVYVSERRFGLRKARIMGIKFAWRVVFPEWITLAPKRVRALWKRGASPAGGVPTAEPVLPSASR